MTDLTEEVLYHVTFASGGNIPFGWHVYVVRDMDSLKRVREAADDYDTYDAYAWTSMANEPREGCIGAMYFVQGWTYVGMVAHECLHLASWMCRYPVGQWPIQGRQQTQAKRMTMGREPEKLAEIVGELTSIVWYNLENDGMTTVDKDS